ncbi:hypothetical protein PFICI_12652 [Pestalotiopsis fici W106-1]|uniref:Clr5 domain-containing protein n=1 Tax=Pestalotiopsis fici (strain W106-1 / CGMCC3.15140) TaxID=1229662 RepID=W3WPB5_PESFW|nr:uncharacterized protein PFICI_12652 [Pestalotiopsis fici W106-1]ETS75708.1 hypothetical protein PFICI_12652 [Pestalotiopsis fici W106-1]
MVFGALHDTSWRHASVGGYGESKAYDAGHESVVPSPPPPPSFLAVRTSSMSSTSVAAARFPQDAHDWDFAAPIIRELYMVQNLPLSRVIEIMTTKHGFKATMYKSRFPKWGWAKNEKRKPPEKRAPRKSRRSAPQAEPGSSEMIAAAAAAQTPLPPTSPADRLMLHESPYARHLYESCRALDIFITSWAARDPRWQGDTLLTSLAVQPLPSYIDQAVSHFEGGDYQQGGKFLRLAFLDVEVCIKDDHVLNIFGLLVEWSDPLIRFPGVNDVEVLMAFSKYVYQQALIHWGNHPITLMCRGLLEATRYGTERVVSWMQSMFRLRIDVFRSLRGTDLATISGQTQFLSRWPDHNMTLDYMQSQHRRIQQIQETYGADHHLVLRDQMALLRIELVQKLPSGNLEARLERLCAATSRYKRSADRDKDPYAALKQHTIFRGSHFLLALFRASQNDWEKMLAACREVIYLDCEPVTPWGSFVVLVIDLLREHGLHEEEERIIAWKKSVELSPSLEKLLEEETASGEGASNLVSGLVNCKREETVE